MIFLNSFSPAGPSTDLLTGNKAGGWGGKAKVAVAAGSGTVVPADAEG